MVKALEPVMAPSITASEIETYDAGNGQQVTVPERDEPCEVCEELTAREAMMERAGIRCCPDCAAGWDLNQQEQARQGESA